MKMKMKMGEGGIKGMASQHIEKLIFGAVLVLVAYFIYASVTQEGLGTSDSPATLKQMAESARTHINRNNWEQIKEDRVSIVENYPDKAELARSKILDKDYALSYIWDKQPIPNRTKRKDPKMLPPTKVEAYAVYAPVAIKTAQPVDPFAGDKAAVAKPKEEPKPKRKKRKPKRQTNLGYGAEFGGGEFGMDEFGGNYDDPASEFGMEGSGAEDSGYGAGPYSGMTGEGARRIGKFYREHYLSDGWQPTSVGSGPTGSLRMVGKSLGVVGVTALVPYERQWEEFERALAEAQGYDPKADSPKYLHFKAQRAEVSDDPTAELQWVDITNSARSMMATQVYGGAPKEIADVDHTMPGVLTMPIPPVLYAPLDKLALHSEIPRKQIRTMQTVPGNTLPTAESGNPLDVINQPVGDSESGLPEIPKIPAVGGGYGGADPYAGAGGYDGAGGTMDEFDSGSYDEMDAGAEGYGTEGYGMDGYGSAGLPQQPQVKHKMIRFFDFSAKPGKTYRYRVCVMLEDPNHPRDPKAEPSRRILDSEAAQRIRAVEAEDEKATRATGKPQRTYYIQTDWSEPSEPVSVEDRDNFLASDVTPGRKVPLGKDGPEVEMSEPSAKVVVVVWDDERATEVPAEREVKRGAFLNFEQDADVLHPLTQQLKTIEQFQFDTGAFVADLRGGEVISGKKTETPIEAPGECLIIDGNGNMVVRNELDNIEEYRRVMFIADEASTTYGGMPSMGYPEGVDEFGGGYEGDGATFGGAGEFGN